MDLAERYEQRYPGALTDSSQKQERMEREVFKSERVTHLRTGRNRGIVVPLLPTTRDGRLRP